MVNETVITEESEFKKRLILILKGSICSIIISLVFMLIFAILLCYTNMQESTMVPVIFVITGISILIGSMISTTKVKKNGLLNGGIVGFIYMLILYLVSSLFLADFLINFNSIIMIIVGIVAGMVGGIIGINSHKNVIR